jgi:hypothetical protein
MPKFFTYRPIMLKQFSFAIIMPISKVSPKYYYRFNQNDVMNMLSKNVWRKKYNNNKITNTCQEIIKFSHNIRV